MCMLLVCVCVCVRPALELQGHNNNRPRSAAHNAHRTVSDIVDVRSGCRDDIVCSLFRSRNRNHDTVTAVVARAVDTDADATIRRADNERRTATKTNA